MPLFRIGLENNPEKMDYRGSMGILDFLGGKNRKNAKKAGGHGAHWQACIGSFDALRPIVIATVEKDGRKIRSSSGTDVFLSPDSTIQVLVMLVDSKLCTAYPVATAGIKHDFQVEKVDEWLNGHEAQVSGRIQDAHISFFDTSYYANKEKYAPKSQEPVFLAGLAYYLKKTDSDSIEREGKKYSTKGMAAFLPFQGGDVDDFQFQAPVKKVEKGDFRGMTFYRVVIPLFRYSRGKEYVDVDVPIYVSERSLKGYVPKEGDDVAGAFWLQGHP
jgi:hypothetical protein